MEDLCDKVARRHYELEIIASQVHTLVFRSKTWKIPSLKSKKVNLFYLLQKRTAKNLILQSRTEKKGKFKGGRVKLKDLEKSKYKNKLNLLREWFRVLQRLGSSILHPLDKCPILTIFCSMVRITNDQETFIKIIKS